MIAPWTTTTRYGRPKPITGKDGTKRSRAERIWGMLYGIVLRNYPKQDVSLADARSVPTNMREFLSSAQRHYRIDETASTAERKTGEAASAGPCPGGCTDFSHKGSNARLIRMTCKFCGTVRSEERHPQRQDPVTCPHIHTDHRVSNAHTRKTCCVDCGTYIDSVPRALSRQHVQLLRIVTKSWPIGYR